MNPLISYVNHLQGLRALIDTTQNPIKLHCFDEAQKTPLYTITYPDGELDSLSKAKLHAGQFTEGEITPTGRYGADYWEGEPLICWRKAVRKPSYSSNEVEDGVIYIPHDDHSMGENYQESDWLEDDWYITKMAGGKFHLIIERSEWVGDRHDLEPKLKEFIEDMHGTKVVFKDWGQRRVQWFKGYSIDGIADGIFDNMLTNEEDDPEDVLADYLNEELQGFRDHGDIANVVMSLVKEHISFWNLCEEYENNRS